MMKKLIYIAPDYFPEKKANSIHVENQVNALAKQGVLVHLIYKSFSGQKSSMLHEDVIELPVKIANRKYSNIKFLIALIRRKRFLLSTPILTRSRLSICLTLLPFSSTQMIFEAHEPLNRLWLKALIKRNSIPVLAISAALKRIIGRELNSSEKIFVLHDGSNLVNFDDVRAEIKIKPKAIYVGSTGRGRGIEWILKLAENFTDLDFHVVGTIDETFKEVGTGYSNVIFHGWKSKSAILSLVKNADILLAPYQNDLRLDNGLNTLNFMSPLKIFEYMSFNVPMVVSNYPVIREVLVDKVDALLVQSDDFEQWANAIQSIKSNPDLARTLSQNARDKLKREYTWEKRAEAIVNLFEWKK